MAISSAGLGSGLDIAGIVSKLVSAERAPTEARLNTQQVRLQTKLSAYGAFKSALSTFRDAVGGLKNFSAFQKFAATSSDDKTVAASGGSTASKGSYSIEVTTLASSHKLASSAVASDTDAIGTGTLSFSFGTYDSGTNTFSTNANKATATVTIDPADNSMRGIRDAVNEAKIGVTASIVKDSSGYRLVFKSDESGAANSLKVTVSGDSSGTDLDATGLSSLAYDPTAAVGSGKNLTQTDAAANASFSVDGLALTSASNKVTDAIQGVTLDLKAETTAAVTVKVAEDKSSITKAIDSFISSFNSLSSTVTSVAGYDKEAKRGGVLLGDSVVRDASSAIRQALTSVVDGAGDYRMLADVGISLQKDGTLKLDKTKLDAALESGVEEVGRLFAATGTPTDPLVRYAGSTSSTRIGEYGLYVSQLATQAKFSGAATGAFPLTVDANNDTFAIKLNGTQSGTITLTKRAYASGTDLATELQTRINGDTALKAAGANVTVSYVGDKFEISSGKYGSSSTIKFTSVDTNTAATLGLSVAAEQKGQDVAGTLDGIGASGSGQFLTGDRGDASGLKLEITGGVVGERGTVAFGRGLAERLDNVLQRFLGSENVLDARTKGLNVSLGDIQDQRSRLETRMEAVEKRYRAQFNALDGLLAKLQATGSQLNQQIASLPGLV